MSGKVILVAGYLAAGKTFFSEKLSEELGITCFNKDYIKEILAEDIGFENRSQNRALSECTFRIMLHIAKKHMERGLPFILESNFRKEDAQKLEPLLNAYGYTPLTFMLTGDTKVLHERFIGRIDSGTRHPAHLSQNLSDLPEFEKSTACFGEFYVGKHIVNVDTSVLPDVDYEGLYGIAKKFLSEF